MKNFFVIILFFCLFSCSFDNQSGVWNEKINNVQLSNINVSDLNKDITFEEYKKIIIIYGKHSEFPDIK